MIDSLARPEIKLHRFVQVFDHQVRLTKNGAEDNRIQVAGVHRYGDVQIAFLHAQMASFLPHLIKPAAPERSHQFLRGDDGHFRQRRAP